MKRAAGMAMDLSGRSLKHYRLVEKLGQGGMGVVYLARDTMLGRDAAVKVLLPDKLHDDVLRQRFHREARAASALNHPNIITIYEIGSEDGIEFIAMEYVAGRTLFSVLRSERLSIARAVGYAIQASEALAKAHAAGITHRDLKPGNLMITGDGLVKVLDFGLARLNAAALSHGAAGESTVYVTRIGAVMGTVAYMSPEQARGEEAGPQSDVFSLGIVLFEMLAGELPFSGNSELAMLHSLNFNKPRDVRMLRPEVPPDLAKILGRMLQQDLHARYTSIANVAQELRALAVGSPSTAVSFEEPTVWLPKRPEPRPRRSPWLLAAVVSILLFAGAGVLAERLGGFKLGTWEANRTSLAAGAFDPETAAPYELFLKARGYLDRFDREENPELAIELLQRAVQKDNNFALGYAALTEAYRYRLKLSPDKQWLNLMEQNAARALELSPDLGTAHIAMALALMEDSTRSMEAQSHLRKAIDLDPKGAAAYKWQGVLLASRREFEGALESLGRAVDLDPRSWSALLDLGLVHYGMAKYAKAVDSWERARGLCPDNVRILANLAVGYHMLDRYEDAASTLQRAIEIQPSAQHHSNLGTLRFFQGRYSEAIPSLEKARDLAPNRYLYWGNLADAYRWSPGEESKAGGTYLRAIQLLQEQLELKPKDPDMRSTLALYLAKSGDKEASLRELSQLESLKPRSAAVLYRMAVAYELCGLRDPALIMLERSLAGGYAPKEIRNEPELLNLREDVRYHEIIAAEIATRATEPRPSGSGH